MSDQYAVVDHVMQLLQHGRRTSTYKHAVLIALMDLCVEGTDPLGWPPSVVTTRQVAEKVVDLYWGQVRPWGSPDASQGDLKQNSGTTGVILREVRDLRTTSSVDLGGSAPLVRVRCSRPEEYESAIREVEWKLIEMPLPKLQRVAKQDTGWLYRIGWDDGANLPSRRSVSDYQAGKASDFDNRILLQPDVALAFVRLHGLLRPFVEQQWVADVARLNGMEENRLHEFLFGTSRVSLEAVRAPLHDLQDGACFYCGDAAELGGTHVDHFVPWALHPENALHNLVLAHERCNGSKSDHLAAVPHLERWTKRNDVKRAELEEVCRLLDWEWGGDRSTGAARSAYLRLPESSRLWVKDAEFEVASRLSIQAALG